MKQSFRYQIKLIIMIMCGFAMIIVAAMIMILSSG
jgi:hypothetical protein